MNNENQDSSKEVETNKKENITMNKNIKEIIQELSKQEVSQWEKEAEQMAEYVLNTHKLGKSNENIFKDLANSLSISEASARNKVACHWLRIQISHINPAPTLDIKFWIQVLPLSIPDLKKWEVLTHCQKHNLTVAEFRKYLEVNFKPLPRKGKNLRKYLLKFRELLPDIDIKDKIKKSAELKYLLGYLVSQSIANRLVNIEDIEAQVRALRPKAA